MQRTYPKQGDHIRYHMGFTTYHHGIFCGDILERKNVVIHFDAKYLSGKVTNISYRKFAKDFKIEIVQYQEETYDSPNVVIYRAMNELNRSNYNLFNNNCEHFAHWCKTGRKASEQINNAIGGGMALVGGVAVAGLGAGAFAPLIGAGISLIGELFIGSSNYED